MSSSHRRPQSQNPQYVGAMVPVQATSSQLGGSTFDTAIAQTAESAAANNADGAHRSMVRTNSTLNHKVAFNKTKKLTKKASMAYLAAFSEVGGGKFHQWSRSELISLIVKKLKIELRNEERLETVALRDLCEQAFANKPVPEKPPAPSFQEVVFQNVMARRIQNTWIIYQATKRMYEEEEEDYRQRAQLHNLREAATEEIGQADLMYLTLPHGQVVADNDVESGMGLAMEEDGKADDGGENRSAGRRRKGLNILDVPWTPPDLSKAKRYADYVQPRRDLGRGGRTPFTWSKTTTGRHCCLGGLGEQLDLWEEGQASEFAIYGPGVTNYFKFMKWGVGLMAALTIIALPELVLNVSGEYSTNNGLQALAKTTLGNLGSIVANQSLEIRLPGCAGYGFAGGVDCSLDTSSLALLYSCLDIAASATIFIAFLWLFIFERYEQHKLEEATIRASMYTIEVSHLPPDATEDEIASFFENMLVSGGTYTAKKQRVVSVSLAFDNVEEIETCKKRGDLIRSKARLVHEHRHDCTEIKNKAAPPAASEGENATNSAVEKQIETERAAFLERMKRLNSELKAVEASLQELSTVPANVVRAFVTFERASDSRRVLELYNKASMFTYLCNNQHLRLRGKYLLVKEAPEPSVIIWENLSFSSWMRHRRRVLTTFMAFLLIGISLIMVFSSKYLQQSAANNGYSSTSSNNLCPDNFDSWSQQEQEHYVEEYPELRGCYCADLSFLQQASRSLCRGYLQQNVQAQVLSYFASLIVLIVNIAIDKAVNWSSDYERHPTSDGRGLSIFWRSFLLKYINTAAVFLINNDNFFLRKIFGLHQSSTSEFTADWYSQIGSTIILVQMGDVLAAHAKRQWQWLTIKRLHRRAERQPESFLTQDELNKAFAGPEFGFASSYAQLMSTFCVTLTFSSGIPLLYPIACANYLLYYYVEKYFFVHIYRIPPHFNTYVGKRATSFIPLGLLLHVVMAIWTLSNSSLLDNKEDDASNAFRVFCFGCLPHRLLLCCCCCCCCVSSPSPSTTRTPSAGGATTGARDIVPFTRAVQRNMIKGLSSYNVLLNPHYKEAFGITWKFAAQHRTVREVRTIKAKAREAEEDRDAAMADQLARQATVQRNDGNANTTKPAASERRGIARNRSFLTSFYGELNDISSPTTSSRENLLPPAASRRQAANGQARERKNLQVEVGSGHDTAGTPSTTPANASLTPPGDNPSSTRSHNVPVSANTSGRSTPNGSTENDSAKQRQRLLRPSHAQAGRASPTVGESTVDQSRPMFSSPFSPEPSPAQTPVITRPPPSPVDPQQYSQRRNIPNQQAAFVRPPQSPNPAPYASPQGNGRNFRPMQVSSSSPDGVMSPRQYQEYQQMQYLQRQQDAYHAAQMSAARRSPATRPPSGGSSSGYN
eukprot:scaffold801_cov178-Ochromonas_danica.AAC.17